MATERASFLTLEPGSWREVMAALAPFLLLGIFPAILNPLRLYAIAPKWSGPAIRLTSLGLVLGLFIIGVIKGFPRWSLPYMGLPLTLFSAGAFFFLISGLRDALVTRTDPWVVRQIAYQGQRWIGVLAAGLLVVLIARILPPLRPFYWRLRRDWTLLSFSLYGTTLFALLFTFDDYVGEEPYQIVGMLLLAAGGWLYLRSVHPWQRFLALFTGLTSAMGVAATGKAILYARPSWPHSHLFTWQTEAMSTVIMWGWLALAILAPGLLGLLSHPPNRLQAE